MTAVVHRPGEGEVHEMGPNTIAIKATSEDTDGAFFLSETTVGPGFPGPPPHTHRTLTDMFYVLEGTLTIRSGDEEIEAPPGTFACFPPGTVHTFRNDSDAPARFLNFNVPGGWEHYMRDLAKAAQSGVPQTPEEIAKIAARYDIQPV
jgi:quercetin dioxygenase-like cupin family protein